MDIYAIVTKRPVSGSPNLYVGPSIARVREIMQSSNWELYYVEVWRGGRCIRKIWDESSLDI